MTHLVSWVTRATSLILLSLASWVHADVLVASYGSSSVLRFSNAGAFIGSLGPAMAVAPLGLAIGQDGAVYTSNVYQRYLSRFDAASGTFMPFTTGGTLRNPHQIAIGGPNHDLYSSDAGGFDDQHALQRFSAVTGEFIEAIRPDGTGYTGYSFGIAFDASGLLYIGDRSSGQIHTYSNGVFRLLATYGGPVEGLTIGPDNRLYVGMTYGDRVLRYTLDGVPAGSGGNPDDPTFINDGRLDRPFSVTFGPDGMIYVVNAGSSEVLRYNTAGTFIDTFIAAGRGGLSAPTYLVFTPTAQSIAAILTGTIQALAAAGTLPPTVAGPLTSTLGAAQRSLASANTTGGVQMLSAFIRQVEAMIRSGRLAADQGASLIATAQAAIDSVATP